MFRATAVAASPGAKSHVVSLSASLQAHVKPLNWYAEGIWRELSSSCVSICYLSVVKGKQECKKGVHT